MRLPQVNISQMVPDPMDLLDLSYNKIYKFVDWLLFVSMGVDLTGNDINTIKGMSCWLS